MKQRILFVCLGNICRSPSAESVFRTMVEKAGRKHEFEIDSAGLSAFHAGDGADSRMKQHAIRRGYRLDSISRQFIPADFGRFDLIIGMDGDNMRTLTRLAGSDQNRAKLAIMTDFCTKMSVSEVPDPYFGGDMGFEFVLDILEDACAGLLSRR